MFARIFGGGAKVPSATKGVSAAPPSRPPPPRPAQAPKPDNIDQSSGHLTTTYEKLTTAVDPAQLRARFNVRLLGHQHAAGAAEVQRPRAVTEAFTQPHTVVRQHTASSYLWVPPKCSILQYIASKVFYSTHFSEKDFCVFFRWKSTRRRSWAFHTTVTRR